MTAAALNLDYRDLQRRLLGQPVERTQSPTPPGCALVKLASTWVRVPSSELDCSRWKTMTPRQGPKQDIDWTSRP